MPSECAASPRKHPRFRSQPPQHHYHSRIGEIENTHYIATEYVEGETLREQMDGGSRMKVQEALDVTLQVARALEAAHRPASCIATSSPRM